MAKKAYCVRNWEKYNKALVSRGSLHLWVNEATLKKWYEPEAKKKNRGRPFTYADLAIETCVILRVLFNLPYRQCQGFVESLFKLLGLEVKTPGYSQICRRQKGLNVQLKHRVKGSVHVVLDGTGLKIFGEGEWKVRQHGYSKHRMWRKLHIGVDVNTREIVMMELTDNGVGENSLLKPLLDQYVNGKLSCVGGDKGYDAFESHEEVGRRGAVSAILPQRKAKVRKPAYCKDTRLVRDDIVRRMRKVGQKKWKEEVGYHKRSLVETTFFRYKTIFGSKLKSRSLENQKMEAVIGCNILNKFSRMGLPNSTPI